MYHVFIRNVQANSNVNDIQNAMIRFGEVRAVSLNRNRDTGLLTGSGIVGFTEKEAMDEALKARELNEKGQSISIYPYHQNDHTHRIHRTNKLTSIKDAYQAGFKAGKSVNNWEDF